MFDRDNKRDKNLNQILQLVKIASLFFAAIAFFQYYFQNTEMYYILTYDWLTIFVVLVVVLLLYASWLFLIKKFNNPIFTTWIQPLIFIVISFFAIYFTGNYQSNYKFLFLFVIISTTIECGIKIGIIMSSVCSVVILGIDLLLAPLNSVNTYFESDLVLVCVFITISWTIGFYVETENEHISYLNSLVNIDGLTGLFNHRFFYDTLSKAVEESRKSNKYLSLLFIDIDYFKYYNDVNGHQKGDEALVIISKKLKEIAREQDTVARYGGEEFAIILPDTTEEDALVIAENLRSSVQEQFFPGQEYLPNKNLTISVGVSVFPTKAKNEDEIIKFADEALYRAKCFRKNRVEAYSSILDDLKSDLTENDKEIIASIKTLIAVINAKDKYTFSHVERVVTYCKVIADVLGFDDHTKKIFIYGAYMHDIGKINIPEEILMKPTPLTKEEWELLKKHPENGTEIIKNVFVLKEVIPIILHHHERYDGTGYPNGLKGENIEYLARILTVIDSFDAMTSYRPYQKKKNYMQAFDELTRCSGSQFDPEVVKVFIGAVKSNFIKK